MTLWETIKKNLLVTILVATLFSSAVVMAANTRTPTVPPGAQQLFSISREAAVMEPIRVSGDMPSDGETIAGSTAFGHIFIENTDSDGHSVSLIPYVNAEAFVIFVDIEYSSTGMGAGPSAESQSFMLEPQNEENCIDIFLVGHQTASIKIGFRLESSGTYQYGYDVWRRYTGLG